MHVCVDVTNQDALFHVRQVTKHWRLSACLLLKAQHDLWRLCVLKCLSMAHLHLTKFISKYITNLTPQNLYLLNKCQIPPVITKAYWELMREMSRQRSDTDPVLHRWLMPADGWRRETCATQELKDEFSWVARAVTFWSCRSELKSSGQELIRSSSSFESKALMNRNKTQGNGFLLGWGRSESS